METFRTTDIVRKFIVYAYTNIRVVKDVSIFHDQSEILQGIISRVFEFTIEEYIRIQTIVLYHLVYYFFFSVASFTTLSLEL